jgi:hypothetical protein
MGEDWDPYIEVFRQEFPEDYQALLDMQVNITANEHNDRSKRCVLALGVEDNRYLVYEVTDVGRTVIDVQYGTHLNEKWNPAFEEYFEKAHTIALGLKDKRRRRSELVESGRMDSLALDQDIVSQDVGRWKGKGKAPESINDQSSVG